MTSSRATVHHSSRSRDYKLCDGCSASLMLSARQHLVRVPFCVTVRMICAWGQLDVPTQSQPSAAGNSPYSPATVLNCHRQGLHSRCPAIIPVSQCHGKGPWRLRTSQNSNVTAACEGPAWSLYNEPQLYDQIFSFRDIPVEVQRPHAVLACKASWMLLA